MAYTPELSLKSSSTLRRIAWTLDMPMTKAIENIFEYLPNIIDKKSSSVRQLIIRVSDQLKAVEIRLIDWTPEETKEAKARLDAQRKKRWERHTKNKDQVNVKRRELYSSKKTLSK